MGWKAAVGISLAVLLLAGCGQGDAKTDIYGDDAAIAQSGDSFSYVERIGGVLAMEADLKFKKFSGADTLWVVDAPADSTLTISYEQMLSRGKCKVVLVSPEGQNTVVAEGSGGGEEELTLKPGLSRIKLVGDRGEGRVNVQITEKDYGTGVDTVNSGGFGE